jgi:hypothetical protein
LALAFNGKTWAIRTLPEPSIDTNPLLSGVSCTHSGQCIAVGSYDPDHSFAQAFAEVLAI